VDVGALRHGQKSWRMKHGPCPAGDGNLMTFGDRLGSPLDAEFFGPVSGGPTPLLQAAVLEHGLNRFRAGFQF